MTHTIQVANKSTGQGQTTLVIKFSGCRAALIAHITRAYPQYHIESIN